ncbi:MAG TPA: ADP-ribosylglycohydrolase family protein [Povalibacter sp.]
MIQQENSGTPPLRASPIANSYWVEPGRLLAGEYPGSPSRTETLDRIQRLLQAGVNTFIDLTEAGELAPYASLLPAAMATHERFPIRDHSLPMSPQHMTRILDAIQAALAQGRCVYVHCRAGIGRTGTTIGCYLVRTGLASEQAIDHLQGLWQQCARSKSWPAVPETDEQYQFVLDWFESGDAARGQALTLADRCEGALLGLAIGDALDTMAVNGNPGIVQLVGHGAQELPAEVVLESGTSTHMTVAVAESLLSCGGHDAEDQMRRYLEASRTYPAARWAPDFKRALASWQWSRKANAGSHDPKNLDPHSLARTLAVALYAHQDPVRAAELAADVSRTTQQSPVILDLCRVWTALLIDAVAGTLATDLWQGPASKSIRERPVRRELNPLVAGSWSELMQQDAGALTACAAALDAFRKGRTFAAGMSHALQSPTAAALYGSLAGACSGIHGIPSRWQERLPQGHSLQALAKRFAA